MKTKDDFNKIFKDVQSVLVILAHPDDAEVICGGIIARLIQQGKAIRLVITN